jgi:outer membrane immunogenic protein
VGAEVRKAWFVAAVTLAATTGPALSADLPRYRSPSSAPGPAGYRWMGQYLGGNFGHQWSRATGGGANPAGIFGGAQAGFNVQSGRLVFGGETDIQIAAAEERFAAWKFSNPWFGTLRARAGLAFDNVLLFGTAGLAYGRGRVEFAGGAESNVHYGWTAGLGLEVGMSGNWSVKAEYLFVGLAEQSYLLTGGRHGFDSNVLRFGVNYRF